MTDWRRTLQRFRDGALSRDELLATVDSLVAGGADSLALENELRAEHAREPLPGGIEAIHARIRADDRTVVQPSPSSVYTDATQVMPLRQEVTQILDGENPVNHRTPVDINTVLLHRFKLVQLVGEGGMSDVYKAIDLRKVEAGARDPHLAVKVLTVRFDDYFSSLSVMHHEASKLQTLTHPNIVRVNDWDRDGQTVFMTMEYLDGTPLKFRMKRDADAPVMPREEALRIVSQMVGALEFAHAKEIVHGDLKPGNVIVTPAGVAKVIDFGIARFLRRTQEDPNAEAWRGRFSALTPHYASPEAHDGADPAPRDDVYALACITHELLTGTHPYKRISSAEAREQKLVLAPSKFLKPTEFRALQKALAFDREERTASVREFFTDLTGERQKARQRRVRWAVGGLAGVAVLGFLWAKFLAPTVKSAPLVPGDVFRDCPTCPLMIMLAPGSFTQGTPSGDADALPFEQPAHAVTLARSFAAGVHEVTVGEYAEFAKDNPRASEGCMAYDGEWRLHASVNWRNAVPGQMSSHPVTCVSFSDATAYAAWLSKRTGHVYRLPSASEWEYFARAGVARPWDDEADACKSANAADETAAKTYPGWVTFACDDDYVRSAPVGTFELNAFGLADTLGNVFEWTQDCWQDDYTNAPTDGSAVRDGDCAQREARGGSWFTSPSFVRPAYRNRFESGYQATSLGFRLVREIANAR